jgi:hypothetical protein
LLSRLGQSRTEPAGIQGGKQLCKKKADHSRNIYVVIQDKISNIGSASKTQTIVLEEYKRSNAKNCL